LKYIIFRFMFRNLSTRCARDMRSKEIEPEIYIYLYIKKKKKREIGPENQTGHRIRRAAFVVFFVFFVLSMAKGKRQSTPIKTRISSPMCSSIPSLIIATILQTS
jgi:hypothetical protein